VDDFDRRHGQDIHRHTGLLEEFNEGIVGITAKADKPADAGVHQHFGAEDAGSMGAIEGSSLDAHAVEGCLDNYVLLGVYGTADLMPGARGYLTGVSQAAQFKAILQAGSSAVISGGQDMFVPYCHCADVMPQAG